MQTATKMNGCHNRKPLNTHAVVQFGWINKGIFKIPHMIKIIDPMTKDCQYQKLNKTDPKCDECKWREE